ncbi:MAG: hypothetical protein PW788_06995 [Micavibrio sp.]|nr:hypothetical protein [Micavibrio sp.]
MRARPIQKETPEHQLWRLERAYSGGRVEQGGQVSFELMLEKFKEEELRVAKDAGMTGSDEEILAQRLKVAKCNNVLRVIADGKVAPIRSLDMTRTGCTLAFAVAAAVFAFTGNEKTEAAILAPVVPTAASAPDKPASAIVPAPVPEIPLVPMTGVASFDYSTNNGTYVVGCGERTFGIHFSKSDDSSIHLYNYDNTIDKVARVKNAVPGAVINFADVDSSSRVYTIEKGETFLLKNKEGYYMQARLRSVADDSRGAAADKVVFEYQINADKTGTFTALPTGDAPAVNKKAIKAPGY